MAWFTTWGLFLLAVFPLYALWYWAEAKTKGWPDLDRGFLLFVFPAVIFAFCVSSHRAFFEGAAILLTAFAGVWFVGVSIDLIGKLFRRS
jgi:hypothetical protein